MKLFASGIFVISMIFFISCASNENAKTVSIVISGMSDTISVKVATTNMYSMKDTVIAETTLDSVGGGSFQLEIEKPSFAHLSIGKVRYTIYLEPGYELAISAVDDETNTIRFGGVGAEPNNYLIISENIRKQSENAGGKSIHSLSKDAFLMRNDSTTKLIENFYRSYIDSVAMPAHITTFLEKRNKLLTLERVQNLGWNYAVEHDNFDLPEELNVTPRIPIDSSLIQVGLSNYAMLIHMNMFIEFYYQIPMGKDELKARGDEAPLLVMNMINETTYPQYFKEFLHVKNVDFWMAQMALTPQLDSAYRIFKRDFPKSKGLSILDARYKRWLIIAKGKPAPDFTGLTPDGNKISFSDLKGRVIYIDIWATWCGPCKEEIPFAKKMQKRFSKVDDVVFLYLSIDEDKTAWKKMVLGDKTLQGVHITSIEKYGESSLWSAYMVWGIPRYMLIDQNGDMVSANALRPSTGQKLDDQIKDLLPPDKQKLVAFDAL